MSCEAYCLLRVLAIVQLTVAATQGRIIAVPAWIKVLCHNSKQKRERLEIIQQQKNRHRVVEVLVEPDQIFFRIFF